MRPRVLLWISLAINVALVILIVQLGNEALEDQTMPGFSFRPSKKKDQPPPRTNVVIRRQHFQWSDVESDNFQAYIVNLRKIGCPEVTIRHIIIGEVNHLFEERKATEIKTPEQQWWKPEPDLDVLQSVADQLRKLEAEKKTLLTELLGPGWEPQVAQANPVIIRFDGPVLSQLSMEVKRAVLQIEQDAEDRRAAAMRPRPDGTIELDPAEASRLRETTRAELAKVLPPAAMEEYLLRYSSTAATMREQLRGFNASPEEFRAIFRVRDNYDHQIASLGNATDAATVRRRQDLERLRDQSISAGIPPDRFPLYLMSQDPLFRTAQEQVEQAGGAVERVLPIYEIQQATQAEVARINSDASLTDEEREVAIRSVEKLQQASIDKLLNPPQ